LKLNAFCPGDSDPYDNLALFHSKHWRPLGERAPWYEMNSFRYRNPEYDKIIDELAVTPPSERDKVLRLFRSAISIWLKDLPVIPIALAPALVPVNTFYWKGFPTADNPWIMPTPWWATMNLLISGYYSPLKDQWIGGIKPSQISYVTVYVTKEIPKFRGIDLNWYGPLKPGDAVRLPEEDANRLLSAGVVSLTPPLPKIEIPTITFPQQINESSVAEISKSITGLASSLQDFANQLSGLLGDLGRKIDNSATSINTLSKDVSELRSQIGGLSSFLMAIIIIQIITIALVILSLFRFRRPS